MLETGNFWMQLEVLFSKVWNGDDVTTLVQQLDETIARQVGGTEN
jgi:arabinogalactan oligomer/maltooligosaccharide transport system substrate-binding protein